MWIRFNTKEEVRTLAHEQRHSRSDPHHFLFVVQGFVLGLAAGWWLGSPWVAIAGFALYVGLRMHRITGVIVAAATAALWLGAAVLLAHRALTFAPADGTGGPDGAVLIVPVALWFAWVNASQARSDLRSGRR